MVLYRDIIDDMGLFFQQEKGILSQSNGCNFLNVCYYCVRIEECATDICKNCFRIIHMYYIVYRKESLRKRAENKMHSWQMLCFDTVAKTKNFSEAAKKLYISQQALSKQIQKMEASLGAKLFIRKPKVALTPEGEIVFEAVTEILKIERNMNQKLKFFTNTKDPVNVGMGYTRNRHMLTKFFPWFLSTYPEIDLRITLDNARNLQKLLLNGDIDFWIGYLAEGNASLECIDLFQDQLMFLVPKSLLPSGWAENQNPLSFLQQDCPDCKFDPGKLPIMLLPKGHTVRTNAEAYIRSFGIAPNVILENNDNETLLMLGLDGVGALFATKTLVDRYADNPKFSNMLQFPVETSMVPQTVSIIRRKNVSLSRAQEIFRNACIEKLNTNS